jgi:hypothetical protein
MTQAKHHSVDLSEYFYCDETSPSGLRWKVNRYAGEFASVLVMEAGQVAGNKMKNGGHWQVNLTVNKERLRLLAHRVIWILNNGDIPDSFVIDHINRDGSDNRLSNLRCVPQTTNVRNSKKKAHNKTGINGVSYLKDKSGYWYHVAHWYTLCGKHKVKYFSTNKYGYDKSLRLACEHRDKVIAELNSQGAGYTLDHGK